MLIKISNSSADTRLTVIKCQKMPKAPIAPVLNRFLVRGALIRLNQMFSDFEYLPTCLQRGISVRLLHVLLIIISNYTIRVKLTKFGPTLMGKVFQFPKCTPL